MSEKHNMLSGDLYSARDPELQKDSLRAGWLTRRFNKSTEEESDKRRELLQELLGGVGKIFISSRRSAAGKQVVA
ncbi:MAG: maltose acetyltransferase domain-containing protein [Candidatus Marinimicrobia bacterium]|nr:maltose acetyltransferase domain-containing protein [Candidatus Neomarinimicrobiota bacterium]